jgi:hypothetical protein
LAYYNDKGQHGDITNEDVSKALKEVATVLNYPTAKGIPNGRIDTHLLQRGGANALSLSGYSDTQIGTTFKNTSKKSCVWGDVQEHSTSSISQATHSTPTDDLINREYEVNVSAASAA